MIYYLLLVAAGFLAGGLNAIAGGGSFLTFPALVYAGVPIVSANATSAVAVFPGYLGAVAGFRPEIASVERVMLVKLIVVSLAGGLAGSLLLLVTSNHTFKILVPWLLLFSTLLFATGDYMVAWSKSRNLQLDKFLMPGVFVVSVYGGYFNGGLGIMLMALFAVVGMRGMNLMNGLKNGVSVILSAISVATFAWAGIVQWRAAVIMMVAATVGGYLGAFAAKALSRRAIKALIVIVGLVMSAVFFYEA
ncbi:MAG: sulfite exporter TauE/SafE family protein [Burkholderiaceae bacterium]|nr:MAG: sulfite exporter TauE/SafE family protein [Burkholderiaceae bacterium]